MSIRDGNHEVISEHTLKNILKLRVEITQHPDYYTDFERDIVCDRYDAIIKYPESAVITSKQLYVIGRINGKMQRRIALVKTQKKLEAFDAQKQKDYPNGIPLP